MRGDRDILETNDNFVLLRMTFMRGVDLGLFAFDYDMTWMSFFLDADCRIYARYGSRDHTSPESHNSPAGLVHTMKRVLKLHKEAMAKPRPEFKLPPAVRTEDLPMMKPLGYAGSCGRCHMLNEALTAQQRKDGKRGAPFYYPLPDTIGIKLDKIKGNEVLEIVPDSFAARAGLKAGDQLRFANRTRLLTVADFQFVLHGLEPSSKLTIEAERDGKSLVAVLNLEGDWRRSDVSWRKSVRVRATVSSTLVRSLADLGAAERQRLGIAEGNLAYRLNDSKGEVDAAGLRKDDVIIAFDGKRKVPYRNPAYYWFIEHASRDKMEVLFLRDGKEQTATIALP